MEWSNVTITSLETMYEGTPDERLSKALDKAAKRFCDKKDYKGAIKAAKKILKLAETDYDNFFGHFTIAISLERMKDIDKAASEASEAIKYYNDYYGSNSAIFWCHRFLASYYISKDMNEKAMEILEKGSRFICTNNERCDYYIIKGKIYYRWKKDYQNGFKMLQCSLQYAESDAEIAMCYYEMTSLEFLSSKSGLDNHAQETIKYARLCLDYVERILFDNQEDISRWRRKAYLCHEAIMSVYEARGENDKVEEEIKHALEYTDGDREAEKELYIDLVECDMKKQDVDATKNLRMLLSYYDTKAEKFYLCAKFSKEYAEHGDEENALRIVLLSLQYAESSKHFAMCYNLIAIQYYKLENLQEALGNARKCLDYIAKITPQNQEEELYWRPIKLQCYLIMSDGYEEMGRKDEAIKEANHALQYTDGDRETEKELYKTIARCHEEREDDFTNKHMQKKESMVLEVRDVFIIKGRGIVVTGIVENGVKVSEGVRIINPDNTIVYSKIIGIEFHRKLLDEAIRGDDVGLLLVGVTESDVKRGAIIEKISRE